MKLVSLVIVLAVTLAGLGLAACGPEKAYCYDEHTTCEQALRDKIKKEADDKADEERLRDAQGQLSDAGALIGQ